MVAKYFYADSQDAAEAMALTYFKCGREELTIDAIKGQDAVPAGEDGTGAVPAEPWMIIAVQGSPVDISNMDAFFTLYYDPDGVYLEIYEERGKGQSIDSQTILHHLTRKKIVSFSVPVVQDLAEARKGRAKIAQQQTEYVYGEDMSVVVTGDELEASVRLLEPEPGGSMLSLDDAKRILREADVTHGIDEEILSQWLGKKEYGEPYVIAKATPPTDGEEGKLIFHFSTDERTGRPREIGHGRVDYRSLDLYVPVEKDQLLVTRTEATEGEPGTTVRGNPIKQKPGKEAMMPRGKNIEVNEDKTEMKSTCSGMVEFVNNAINVSNVYTVTGDCDISIGNIDFEGSVHISGSVRSGNTVTATDGINVGGSVEAATLIAGGNVEVKGGMQGSGKGKIEAGGSVSIMFIERGTIIADGPVTVDVSIHSKIETASTILAFGKRGAIIGGQAGAAGDITANYIGALSNTKTDVEVGFMPRKRARLVALEKEMERLSADRIKLTQLDAYLERTKSTMEEEMWEKLYKSGMENKRVNHDETSAVEEEIETIRYEMDHATDSKVHVLETAFNGSRIGIGSGSYKVNDDISFATFRFSDGEIVYGPCEKNKADIK